MLHLRQADTDRIAIFSAGRSVRHEAGAVVDGLDGHRLGRDPDNGRTCRDVLRDDRVCADLGAFADLDRTKDRAPEPITTFDPMVGWRLPPAPVVGLVPPRVTCW